MNITWKILASLFLLTGVVGKCKFCFPKDFLWSVATSAYQIEGSWNTSGKGENIWDYFTHNYPEKILDGSNGDIACDSYNKYKEDVTLLNDLGVNFYRFSLSWSRILPEGTVNNVNQEGVDYYLNLFKELKENKIEPLVTLYHWDLPYNLQLLGGWANPLIADYFEDYASLCFKLFGDYVKYWVTINEPLTFCIYGYSTGTHAPGIAQSGTATYYCAHSVLLAHAKAYHVYNNIFRSTQNGKVGLVFVNIWYEPLTNSTEDAEIKEQALQIGLGLFANPIFNGNWPQTIINRIGNLSIAQGFERSRLPTLTDDEIVLIKGTHDFLGLNYYTTYYASKMSNLAEIENYTVSFFVDRGLNVSYDSSWPRAKSSWLYSVPPGIRGMLNWVSKNYGRPEIFILENGWSDEINVINDTDRIDYLKEHLCQLLKAKYLDGINVIGYTHWSLIDNFEWGSGYTEGFGLVSVNFNDPNRTRTPKQSFYWYQNIIKERCLACSF